MHFVWNFYIFAMYLIDYKRIKKQKTENTKTKANPQKRQPSMTIFAKKRPNLNFSPKLKIDEKNDSYPAKRHPDPLPASRLGRQTFGLHFATSS